MPSIRTHYDFDGAARLLSTLDLSDILHANSDVNQALLIFLEQWLIANGASLGDARSVELQVAGNELQWRWIDTPPLSWEFLFDLSTLEGAPGADGADGNDIISGTAVPTGSDGLDGNFYIRLPMLDFYGPKAAGNWPSPISLIGPQGDSGPTGATGDDGAPGADGLTVLNGTGVPSGGIGVNGDFYIRTATWEIYGPKTGGSWGSPTSLIGADGAPGADGTDGADGATGPQGPQGPTGATGGVYEHVQSSAAATWTITHNLGTRAFFVVFLDSDPTVQCFTDQTHPDLNTTVLEFPSAVSGKAYA